MRIGEVWEVLVAKADLAPHQRTWAECYLLAYTFATIEVHGKCDRQRLRSKMDEAIKFAKRS